MILIVRREEGLRFEQESGAWLDVKVTAPSPALVTTIGAAAVPEVLMSSTSE